MDNVASRSNGVDDQENCSHFHQSQTDTEPKRRKQHHYDVSFTQVESVVTDLEGLSLAATGLYIYLASFCHGAKNECWPGIQTICKRFGCNRKTINRYLAELEEQGLIEITQR